MEIRKTPQRLVTLEVLAQLGESHGFEIATRAGLKLGTVYGVLMGFEQAGFVESRWEDGEAPGRPPRKRYRLTDSGQALLLEYRAHFGPRVRRSWFAALTGELHAAIDLVWGGMFQAANRPEMARQKADATRREAVARRVANAMQRPASTASGSEPER